MCSYIYINVMTVPQCKDYFDIIHDIYFLTADWNNTKLDTKVKKKQGTSASLLHYCATFGFASGYIEVPQGGTISMPTGRHVDNC